MVREKVHLSFFHGKIHRTRCCERHVEMISSLSFSLRITFYPSFLLTLFFLLLLCFSISSPFEKQRNREGEKKKVGARNKSEERKIGSNLCIFVRRWEKSTKSIRHHSLSVSFSKTPSKTERERSEEGIFPLTPTAPFVTC